MMQSMVSYVTLTSCNLSYSRQLSKPFLLPGKKNEKKKIKVKIVTNFMAIVFYINDNV